MIDLTGIKPFAEGGNRACYQHPNKINVCLKITHHGLPKKLKNNAAWYKKLRSEKSFDDNFREANAYQQNSINLHGEIIWNHLARWYGFEDTSLGIASATELILNNGVIAETLESYLYKHGKTEQITHAINDFEIWLRKTLLLTKNILPHNLVVQKKDTSLALKIIDGLGCSSFLKLPKYNNFFAKQYVNRRLELMHSRIDWDISGRKGSWK
jgi:hypothetical protein